MSKTFFDDFAVYDCVLTTAQVLALYEASAAKSTECPAIIPDEPVIEPNADAVSLIGDAEEADITALLKNANFANGGNGWEGTVFTAAPGTVAEHYYKLFDTYQILPNMPAGLYRLSWQGFYRNGNIANDYLRHTSGTEGTAEVYANENAVDMLSLYDASAPYTYDPYTYPDNVTSANNAFQAGNYQQSMEFTLNATTDLRIGLRNFVPTVQDWACVDNFSLIYMKDDNTGIETIDNGQLIIDNSIYDLSGRKVANGQWSMVNGQLKKGIYIQNGKKTVINY
jgi:hypothetical protein